MKKVYTHYLYGKYPELYFERENPRLPMSHGFSCGDGWFDLVDDISTKLVELDKLTNIRIRAAQVKEKYGELRFYVNLNVDKCEENVYIRESIILAVIDKICAASKYTCELCGNFANNKRDRLSPLCDDCFDKKY